VLDGVLPIHAACSGGNDLVVRLLIENGADVNAPRYFSCILLLFRVLNLFPRLPRRYSNDKHRDASAPIVGASGSTPLHFAAANGHTAVVSTLLLHGAHPHRPDKHGVTPEMLASQYGQFDCVELLRDWQNNKDKDLREREATLGEHHPQTVYSAGDNLESYSRKRLHVKHSIDNAFHIFRHDCHSKHPHASSPPSSHRSQVDQPYVSKALGEYTFYPVEGTTPDVASRRPSLPQQHVDVPKGSPHSHPHSSPSPRRPRSAGTGAESPAQVTHTRKLGTKYSLLHLFKKAQPTGEVSTSTAGSSASTQHPYHAAPPQASASVSALPIPIPSTGSKSPSTSPKAAVLSSSLGSHRSRFGSDDGVLRGLTMTKVEQHSRDHSPSGIGSRTPGGGLENDDGSPVVREQNVNPPIHLSPQQRNRSSSHGFRSTLRFDSTSSRGGSSRLRHDSNSSVGWGLKERGSADSLTFSDRGGSGGGVVRLPRKNVPESAPAAIFDFQDVTVHPPGGDDEEEEYGIPIQRSSPLPSTHGIGSPRLMALRNGGRSVASSSSSLERQDLSLEGESPFLPDVVDPSVTAATSGRPDFPFSLNGPPPFDLDGPDRHLSVHPRTSVPPSSPTSTHVTPPLLPPGIDSRLRGDSVSSTSTDGSHNPQLSSSGTTATSGSSVTTPGIVSSVTASSLIHDTNTGNGLVVLAESGRPQRASELEESTSLRRGGGDGTGSSRSRGVPFNESFVSIGERRAHTPLDIDIRSISSHAQAEALVQQAQRSILEMEDYDLPLHFLHDDDDPNSQSGGLTGAKWTPLSAKLAAYGESLAIERKLKQAEENKKVLVQVENQNADDRIGDADAEADAMGEEDIDTPGVGRSLYQDNVVMKIPKGRRAGLERQFSLEQKSSAGSHSRIRVPKRPNTSSGMTTETCQYFLCCTCS
jgi:Ankyrin repeats (3 copies)/Ankyrin repeat